MRVMVAAALLALAALLFETNLPQAGPAAEDTAHADQQADTRLKTLSANWVVSIPFVGCENGKPLLNLEVPDANAPSAICPGAQPPDVLLQRNAPRTVSGTHDGAYEVGTVIVMAVSQDKIVLAADSRNVRVMTRTLADGTTKRDMAYDDCACKLIQLTPAILFAADGQVWASNTIPATELYDAHKLAKLAAQNYNSIAVNEQLAGGRLAAIATRWAWDVDFRMHHGLANGWTPIQRLEGIFAGLELNGEIGFAIARLDYPRPRNGVRVPPVAFTIGTLKPLPTDFTWVEAYGIKDVAESYYSARAVTEQTEAENKRISTEMLKKPALFSAKVPERLVDLTIQYYEAAAQQGNPLFVHGPIDVGARQE